ncbi:MAG TPA: hypothetical protein VKU01_24305 [Bryobacteraceae bacterium]|nr:hypothetical protein [Bryobacteraceae bacterium]
MKRAAVCLALVMSCLAAQQKLPPAMRSALSRIAHGETAPTGLITARVENGVVPPSTVCSVPLREMRVDHPERFTMLVVPAPKNATIPQTGGPAPPCETNTQDLRNAR